MKVRSPMKLSKVKVTSRRSASSGERRSRSSFSSDVRARSYAASSTASHRPRLEPK